MHRQEDEITLEKNGYVIVTAYKFFSFRIQIFEILFFREEKYEK